MIIQCPDCASRYRIKDISPGRPAVRLVCPKCTFRFSLIAPESVGQPPVIRPNPRVLLVDDAHFFREMLADLLAPLHLNISLVADAAETLDFLNNSSSDLLLLDLNLPDKNGLDLIREIRAKDQGGQMKILAMSGVYRREEDSIEAIRAGADGFLNKSFRPDELREKVEKLLGK